LNFSLLNICREPESLHCFLLTHSHSPAKSDVTVSSGHRYSVDKKGLLLTSMSCLSSMKSKQE